MNRIAARNMKTTKTPASAKFLLALAMMLSSTWLGAVTYTYDSLNRLVEVAYDNGATQTYGYDAGGNRLSMAITPPPGVDSTTTSTTSTTSTTTTTLISSTTTTTTGSTTTTTLAGTTLNLQTGWNLVGNSSSNTLSVASTFGDTAKVTTVWKWIAATLKWAFYSPSLSDGGAAYAASKGYEFLITVNAGEGFWVNAKAAFATALPAVTPVATTFFVGINPLVSGWNLIAVGDNPTPRAFNNAIGATPPAEGDIPTNVISLWAWDSTASNWYFYAPNLDQAGTLGSYISSKNYLNFSTLDPATGFWVNKP